MEKREREGERERERWRKRTATNLVLELGGVVLALREVKEHVVLAVGLGKVRNHRPHRIPVNRLNALHGRPTEERRKSSG